MDCVQRGCARLDGQIDEIDIDREARKFAHEQVDRGSALERKIFLGCDLGNRTHEQRNLRCIDVGAHRLVRPALPDPRSRGTVI